MNYTYNHLFMLLMLASFQIQGSDSSNSATHEASSSVFRDSKVVKAWAFYDRLSLTEYLDGLTENETFVNLNNSFLNREEKKDQTPNKIVQNFLDGLEEVTGGDISGENQEEISSLLKKLKELYCKNFADKIWHPHQYSQNPLATEKKTTVEIITEQLNQFAQKHPAIGELIAYGDFLNFIKSHKPPERFSSSSAASNTPTTIERSAERSARLLENANFLRSLFTSHPNRVDALNPNPTDSAYNSSSSNNAYTENQTPSNPSQQPPLQSRTKEKREPHPRNDSEIRRNHAKRSDKIALSSVEKSLV